MTTTISTRYLHSDFAYTQQQQEQYEHEGYLFFDRFLSDDGLTRCRTESQRMIESLGPGRSAESMISAHQQEEWIFNLANEPKLLDMLEKQIGPNIVLWSSHMLCKPPRIGEAIPWHQDAPYWNTKGNFAAGVWIPFDDIEVETGAMAVLPRWHRKGVLPRRIEDRDLFNQEIEPTALPANADELKVDYLLKAGQAAIHDVMIPHSSPPNTSDRWRRVLVLRYIAADGEFGPKTYEHYRTGEPFERGFFLVRGEDVANKGLARSPFE